MWSLRFRLRLWLCLGLLSLLSPNKRQEYGLKAYFFLLLLLLFGRGSWTGREWRGRGRRNLNLWLFGHPLLFLHPLVLGLLHDDLLDFITDMNGVFGLTDFCNLRLVDVGVRVDDDHLGVLLGLEHVIDVLQLLEDEFLVFVVLLLLLGRLLLLEDGEVELLLDGRESLDESAVLPQVLEAVAVADVVDEVVDPAIDLVGVLLHYLGEGRFGLDGHRDEDDSVLDDPGFVLLQLEFADVRLHEFDGLERQSQRFVEFVVAGVEEGEVVEADGEEGGVGVGVVDVDGALLQQVLGLGHSALSSSESGVLDEAVAEEGDEVQGEAVDLRVGLQLVHLRNQVLVVVLEPLQTLPLRLALDHRSSVRPHHLRQLVVLLAQQFPDFAAAQFLLEQEGTFRHYRIIAILRSPPDQIGQRTG